MKIWHGAAFLLFLSTAFSFASISPFKSTGSSYGTWQSLEPDAWASVWLIQAHIDPEANITIRPSGFELDVDTPFAVPGSDFVRDRSSSGFEKLLAKVETLDPTLIRMGEIVHAMESATWASGNDEAPRIVEQAFRTLQDRFDRDYVPVSCYGQFFNALYSSIEHDDSSDDLARNLNTTLASIESDCAWDRPENSGQVVRKEQNRVKSVEMSALLNAIANGQKVIFVDTRETQEFEEGRIPGAINIKLRNIDAHTVTQDLKSADIVVSYCLKDFRGYEVARKLLHHGVENSAVMDPHGYVAWRTLGLPIQTRNEEESVALAELNECAASWKKCLGQGRVQ